MRFGRILRWNLGALATMAALWAVPVMGGDGPPEPAAVDWGMKGVEAVGLKQAFEDFHLKFYGWVEQSFTFNTESPNNRINVLRAFDDRSNDYRFNQFAINFERVLADGKGFDVGAKVEAIYGSDSRFIHAKNLPDANSPLRDETVQIDPTQFYGLVRVPLGNGLTVKFGKYVSLFGAEAIDAPSNLLFSHSFISLVGPNTHTGIEFDYPIADNLAVYYGLVRGWDVFGDNNNSMSQMVGSTIKLTDRFTTAFNVISGPERPHENTEYRTLFDMTATYQWTDRFTTMLNFDFGNEGGAAPPGNNGKNWWGIAGYATYKFTPLVSSTLRAEFFRDETASRIGFRGDLTEVTLGVDIHPLKALYNLRFRPEFRWDHAIGADPFDQGTKQDQFTLGGDMVFTF